MVGSHFVNQPEASAELILRATLTVSGSLVPADGVWERVLGWSPADLRGASFIERVHPDDQEAVIAAIHTAYASGLRSVFACRYGHKDGSYLWLRWDAVLLPGRVELDLSGRPAG